MNNDFTISLGEKSSIRYHDAHGEQDFIVTLAETGNDTMTGGRLKRAERHIDGDTFMMTYGDGVADVDLNALLAFHRQHGKLATVTTVITPSRFGHIAMGLNGEVTDFSEKPQTGGWVSAGFFVFNRGVFDYLKGGDACVFEGEPLVRLTADDQLRAYQHKGFFFAMDTYREYLALNEMWASNRAPWKVWG